MFTRATAYTTWLNVGNKNMHAQFNTKVTKKILCIGFLQQGAPEFIALLGVHVDEFIACGGQLIINQYFDPTSILPEHETEHT